MERFVKITREGDMLVVSDQDGEYARADSIGMALPYVAELVYGPGTMSDDGLAGDLRRPVVDLDADISNTVFGI